MKQLVDRESLNFAIALLPSFFDRGSKKLHVCSSRNMPSIRQGIQARGVSVLCSALCYKFETKRKVPKTVPQNGPKNGGQKVDPKMGPPLMNLFIATPFSGPLFDPAFCCDPTFEHNFEATEAAQHKQNLYG